MSGGPGTVGDSSNPEQSSQGDSRPVVVPIRPGEPQRGAPHGKDPEPVTSQETPALEVSEVRFSYDKTPAVDGVSFTVQPGEIFGLLGPNGAGKTTTIAMITGLLRPASGQVLLFGKDPTDSSGQARTRLGVVPQDIALYDELKVRENLHFWGEIYGLSGPALKQAVEQTAELVGLTDRAGDRVDKLSGGLKRRLNLGVGLVHSPDLIVLDEPTVGIDPQARLRILEVVKDQAKAGCAVLYTSHYLEEAEQLCDRIAIMDHGRTLAVGTVDELRKLVGEGPVIQVRGDAPLEQLTRIAEKTSGVSLLTTGEGTISFSAEHADACSAFVRELFQSGAKLDDLRIQEPNLQSLFLKLTGRELRD